MSFYGILFIDRGAAEVNSHIPKGDIFNCRPLRNVIFILLYQTFSEELNMNCTRSLCCACTFFYYRPREIATEKNKNKIKNKKISPSGILGFCMGILSTVY